jgi:hypothetical protein
MCQPRPTQGMPCSRGECGPGLFCDIFGGSQCQPRLALGMMCDDIEPSCVDGAYCQGGTCVAQHAAGGECTSNDECASGVCYSYQFCQATAMCTML